MATMLMNIAMYKSTIEIAEKLEEGPHEVSKPLKTFIRMERN